MIDPSALARRRAALRPLGVALSPAMVGGTTEIMAETLPAADPEGLRVETDLAYGPHERHRLDVYRDGAAVPARPVVVYVHGGGFVHGAKSAPGSPYYRNVGTWAVASGFLAVIVNYRLAPESTWPGGADDLARAISWVRENISAYGGDPKAVFLFGQSAGSMHVADYLTLPERHLVPGGGLRGAILLSCVYDLARADDKPFHHAYWGQNRTDWAMKSSLPRVVALDLPLLFGVAELDEPQFVDQAAVLTAAWHARHGEFPPLYRLFGHNHLSTVYGIGGDTDDVGPLIAAFIEANL